MVVKGPRVKRRSRGCLICVEVYIRKPTGYLDPSTPKSKKQENNFVGCERRGRRKKRKKKEEEEEEQQQKEN